MMTMAWTLMNTTVRQSWRFLCLFLPKRFRGIVYAAMFRMNKRIIYGDWIENVRVARIPFGVYLKRGYLQEALATKYVATHTTIPVPIILDIAPAEEGKVWMLMTELPGKQLGQRIGNLRNLSPHQLQVVEDTLRDWFDQLRSLDPPDPDAVCAFGGYPIKSNRISHMRTVGPFLSQREFHMKLVEGYEETLGDVPSASHSKPHRICFTHGDISPYNILVDDDKKPCALIDFECAGWMPEYWEYTYALYIRYPRYKEWCDLFTRIFPQYPTELEVEYRLWEFAFPW
ncbi:kinase-like protein [Laetiporus sulphureus 93-53]|uniref:Kinase-like protein n=1 Tax=Laetiporus sulphureus 93-53 TaxID=1314785 RepID=A0A165EX82_9APHY|nr:kinase-like protein [Laetiporus sulphureus 93-53]KZT07918.1 kinase-like protein [Laetiporus sulphureus 93-53]